MGLPLNAILVFSACLAVANAAVHAPFPDGKYLGYNYRSAVKAATDEPASFVSQFAIEGRLDVVRARRDPKLTNAYYVKFLHFETSKHIGEKGLKEEYNVIFSVDDDTILRPFLIVYAENGTLEGVKFMPDEPAWSRNMKMAIASMFQLDMPLIESLDSAVPRHDFVTTENTIYGKCITTCDIQPKDPVNTKNDFVVTKFLSMTNCTDFVHHSFDHVDEDCCDSEVKEPLYATSKRTYEIERQAEGILIKKVVAEGIAEHLPWNAQSEAHYVMTRTTLKDPWIGHESVLYSYEEDFSSFPLIRDLTYRKPEANYASTGAADVTQGRRVLDSELVMGKLQKMLLEAADYLDENHIEMKAPNWTHGQTLNRIQRTMGYMNEEGLEMVFDSFKSLPSLTAATVTNIFLGMIPQVGTTASCIFTVKMIREKKIDVSTGVEMLAKLPLNVRSPSMELLQRIEELLKFDKSAHPDIRKAATLSVASLIYRTSKFDPTLEGSSFLKDRLDSLQRQMEESDKFDITMVCLMAMRNIQIGNIHERLRPVISGAQSISEYPMRLRLLAIWAIEKSVEGRYPDASSLLWPVMANATLPVSLRIASYQILMHQAPTMSAVLRIHSFMLHETNEHLYNYHYTTMKALANSVYPCKRRLREFAKKIIRATRRPGPTLHSLSAAYIMDYNDEKYNHAEKLHADEIIGDEPNVFNVLQVAHVVTEDGKSVSNFAIRMHIQGLNSAPFKIVPLPLNTLSDVEVLDLLKSINETFTSMPELLIDIVVELNGRVVVASHYDSTTMMDLCEKLMHIVMRTRILHPSDLSIARTVANYQYLKYSHMNEKHITTDVGVPVVLETRIPVLVSMRLRDRHESTSDENEIGFIAKIWRHGDHSMSVYNPFVDAWHSVRRSTALDVSVPIDLKFHADPATGQLKISLARLPATELSIGGILNHAKDSVTLTDDEIGGLNRSCPTYVPYLRDSSCSHREEVSIGTLKEKDHQSDVESRDTGLRYSMAIFDCENGLTPTTMIDELYKTFGYQTWKDRMEEPLLMHRLLRNAITSPKPGSCGTLLKIEPSNVYPASRVDIVMGVRSERVDPIRPMDGYVDMKHRFHATVDVIEAATNNSMRSWDSRVTVVVRDGHLINVVNIQLTKKTPGAKPYKICLDAEKNYLGPSLDLAHLPNGETNTKLTIVAGSVKEDECPWNQTRITITVKGEVSDKQKIRAISNISSGPCGQYMYSPVLANPKNLAPLTRDCILEVVDRMTLAKHTISLTHNMVPTEMASAFQYLQTLFLSRYLPNLKYINDHVETGNITIVSEYHAQEETYDVFVATPTESYELRDIVGYSPQYPGFGTISKCFRYMNMNDTLFNGLALSKYVTGNLQMCSIYPELVQTVNRDIRYVIRDEWILIAGDPTTKLYAVFAKKVGSNIAVKMYVEDHALEIIPSANNTVQVILDGVAVDHSEEIVISAKEWGYSVKLARYGDRLVAKYVSIPIFVVYGLNHVTIAIENASARTLSGLCAHLEGSRYNDLPQVYTLPKQ